MCDRVRALKAKSLTIQRLGRSAKLIDGIPTTTYGEQT
jgi:hypothetical protein